MASPGNPRRRVLLATILLAGAAPGGLTGQQVPSQADSAAVAAVPDSAPASLLPELPKGPVGAPVIVRGDTLFFVHGSFGAVTAATRALAIADRIKQAAGRVRAGLDTVRVVTVGGEVGVAADSLVLMAILPADVGNTGETRVALATRYAEVIKDAIARGSLREQVRQIGVGVVLALAATLLLLLLRLLLLKALGRVDQWVDLLRGSSRLPTLKFQQLELLSSEKIADALRAGLRLLRLGAMLVLVYFYLVAVLGLFPWTRGISTQILGYLVDPLGVVAVSVLGYLPHLFFVVIIVLVTRYLLRGIRALFHGVETGLIAFDGFDRDWAMPTYKLARFMVMAFALVVMWPYLPGSDSDAFKGVSLFVGLIFSLGSTVAVANLVAGSLLTYTRAFQVGDRVRIGDTTGDVVARSLMVTRVRTVTNIEVTIPNNMVMSSAVLNFSTNARRGGILIQTTVTIGYDVPWRRVHELLLRAARATDGVAADPPPFVLQTGLNDYYPEYELNGHITDPQAMRRILSDLNGKIQDAFAEGGVEITSPAFTSLRDGNASTIPAPHTPSDPPAFRVQTVEKGN